MRGLRLPPAAAVKNEGHLISRVVDAMDNGATATVSSTIGTAKGGGGTGKPWS
jgi:hypothetical protein